MSTNELAPQLDVIIAAKRQYLQERKSKTPIEAIRALAGMQDRPQPVLNTVTTNAPILFIGQIKYKLGQSGLLSDVYDPVASAVRFAKVGADAVALFTDENLYQGGLDDLLMVSEALKSLNLPVISQDYILDEYQIVESRAAGASALIISARVLDQPMVRALMSATHRNRMTAIVEVSTHEELMYALTLSPYVIGIRDHDSTRRTLDLEKIREFRALIPPSIRVMFTEGLKTLDEVTALVDLGMDAVLVQESLLDHPEEIARLQSLLNPSH